MPSETFGSLVSAICINLILYTLEVIMAYRYFGKEVSTRRGDGYVTKLRVWTNLAIDSFGSIAGLAFLFLYEGTNWEENDGTQKPYWRTIASGLTLGAIAALIVQSFMLSLFFRNIQKRRFGTVFFVTILVVVAFAAMAATLGCAYIEWNDLEVSIPFIWIALGGNAIVAAGVTTVLICQRIALKDEHINIGRFYTRMAHAFVETGFPSTIIALLALIAWAVGRKGDFILGLIFVQPRLYSCTMLFILNHPASLEHEVWIHDMESQSVLQKNQPLPPQYPDVVFNAPTEKSAGANRKYNRSVTLCAVPEAASAEPWHTIDLGDHEVTASPIALEGPEAMEEEYDEKAEYDDDEQEELSDSDALPPTTLAYYTRNEHHTEHHA
ncbi:hypothetical protein C8J57DRAFT_1510269 [Mycena rebaudengoi]|nr:hypothetical protein C8J57DRAFT_1510269 [Mycena rebaudengoi]